MTDLLPAAPASTTEAGGGPDLGRRTRVVLDTSVLVADPACLTSFTDADVVAHTLDEQYAPVSSPGFGDLVVLVADGEIFHSAVHIADGVVFTRNGQRLSRPWMLLPLPAMLDFYPRRDIKILYLRRIEPPDGSFRAL